MTRIRKMLTKEVLAELLNQMLIRKDEEIGSSSISKVGKSTNEETERKQRKRKKENIENTLVKKKKKLEWEMEDCAQSNGKLIKFTGEGKKMKCHYEKFKFHDNIYGLDIFVEGKEGYVKLEVQWFYRPEDIEKKYVRNREAKDARELFYSFHRDVVFAESVKHSCLVHFVPENKQIPNRREHPGFVVQQVYNIVKKKLCKFSHNDFNEQEKNEINFLVAKTILRTGDLPDIKKEQKTLKSRRQQFAQKRNILKVEITSPGSRNVVNTPDYKSILEKFDILTGDSDRDKRLEELLESVKHKCRLTEKKQASDYDSFWPNDVVPVVRALEQVCYESFGKDISKYNRKLAVLIDNLKNSRMLAERLLKGELIPEQFIKMKHYELMNGHTLDEMTAVIDEPVLKIDDSYASKKC